MEEFKYLEGIINLCTEELYNGDRNIHATLGFEELKELQNLLNKRKALEIHTGILINKNKEQEKMIELMSDGLKSDVCFGWETKDIIDYFRKKAKGE